MLTILHTDEPSAPYPTAGYNTTVTLPATTIVQEATVTATVTFSVSTVVIQTPIVWIVEPSAAPGATVYPTACSAHGTEPTSPTVTKGAVSPTGTGVMIPTPPADFTGAASSVQVSGVLAAIVGGLALLL